MSEESVQQLSSALAQFFQASPDDYADVAKYVSTMETADDVEGYLVGLLGDGKRARRIVDDARRRWASPSQRPVVAVAETEMYVKPKREDVVFIRGKKKDPENFPPAAQAQARRPAQPVRKEVVPEVKRQKRAKFVPIAESDVVTARIPGRHACQCLAQRHELVNNCTNCGRIVCVQEGSGPCLFCGTCVYSPRDLQLIAGDTKRGRKLSEKFARMKEERDAALAKAIKHKDRLIEFDRTSERRTKVIDDEMDYFSSETNQWLSPDERRALKQREDELREVRKGSRLSKKKFTLDFAGRRLLEEGGEASYDSGLLADLTVKRVEDMTDDRLVDPNVLQLRPKFRDGGSKSPAKKREIESSEASSGRLDKLQRLRIQDKEYLEMGDDGMCLSMHQPWALLLVMGIKRHEGRTWYTAHRGRLWIAATAKIPSDDDIAEVESEYRRLLGNIDFPESYPSGCLLGCVDVVDCMAQEDYRQQFLNGESSSPYVFVCENARELVVRFPVKGQHKIWKLDKKTHEAAKKGINLTLS